MPLCKGGGAVVNNLIDNLVVNLFGIVIRVSYLCIDNERSSRAGSLGDAWSVDSHVRGRVRPLPPTL